MTGALSGARVLIPRGGGWGEAVAEMLRARGAEAIVAPVIATIAPLDVEQRDQAFGELAAGAFDWLFVTSATTIDRLDVSIPASTRVAVVGPSTARAAAHRGIPVAFEPQGEASAQSMIEQWLRLHGGVKQRTLVVRSDLATSVVSDELELRGHDVRVCIGYRTIGVDLPAQAIADLRGGAIDVVLLTSLSVARELRRQVGALPAATRVASIGAGTTHDAEALGYTISHTASRQSMEALIDDLDALQPHPATATHTRTEEIS